MEARAESHAYLPDSHVTSNSYCQLTVHLNSCVQPTPNGNSQAVEMYVNNQPGTSW
jgi:hypothetical protein